MILEGVPTPIPILEDLALGFGSQEKEWNYIPCLLDEIYCLSQLDVLGKEFCYYGIFFLKDS